MTQLQVCYQGSPVEFELINGHVYANGTAMCKSFNKRPNDWYVLPSTQRYIQAITGKSGISDYQLFIKRQGSPEHGGGTWIHEKLILKLAQWLDVDFEIWCDEQVARLLRWQQSINAALPQSLPDALRALATEIEAKEALNRQLTEAQPKLDHYQQVMDADGSYTVGEVAKMIGAGPNKLFAFLRETNVMYQVRNHNVPIQTYVDNGWFRVKQSSYQHGDRREAYPKLYVTSKGVEGIRRKWLAGTSGDSSTQIVLS